jgi:hypothetical protein
MTSREARCDRIPAQRRCLPAARPVGCDPRWGARAARASDRGLVYTMQVISHKSWGGYPGGRMLKILFRGAGRSGRDGSIVVAGVG